MKRLALALTSVLFAQACEEVPTLTFAQADAPSEAAQDAAEAYDADIDGGCPGPNPPQAPFVCCGPVACEGVCTGQCGACMEKCMMPGDVCCAKTNNVVCLPAGSICH
jgi:hypothetical protein